MILGRCTAEWESIPYYQTSCADTSNSTFKDLLSKNPLRLGCFASFKSYLDTSLSEVATIHRGCHVRTSYVAEGCSRRTTGRDTYGAYSEVVCHCSTNDFCNTMVWPTVEMGQMPFTEPESNKDWADTYLAGKQRSCLLGAGTKVFTSACSNLSPRFVSVLTQKCVEIYI